MQQKNTPTNFSNESGSALVYILIAIALLATLTYSFMQPSGNQTSSQNIAKIVASVKAQAALIQSAFLECSLSYRRGDDSIVTIGGSATDLNARVNFPIKPNSTHYTGADLGPAADRKARNARCPGQKNGADPNDHAKIFSAKSGRYLPPAPDLFSDWQIYNGTDGVFYWIETDKSDSYLISALTKLDASYAECEADVVDATLGAINLDSENTVTCTNGSTCFRVRMIQNASATWLGDSDNDECECRGDC